MQFDDFKRNLRHLIESRGYTSDYVAKMTGMNPVSVSRYMHTDRMPQLAPVIELAQFFGVSVDWLLGLTNNTEEDRSVQDLYNIASPDDRQIVDAVLKKYKED